MADEPQWDDVPTRLSAEQIARLRSGWFFKSRWLARILAFGECLHDEAQELFGARSPAVLLYGAELGPQLAASAVGAPVNWGWRPHDQLRSHWHPHGPTKFLEGLHPEILVGFVERAWSDERGVNAVLGIFRHDCHADLEALEQDDALAFAGMCCVQNVDTVRSRSPWGLSVAHVTGSRVVSVDFNSAPMLKGSHVLRRLALDEDPDEREIIETEPRLIPKAWRGAAMTPTPETPSPLGCGTIGNPELGTGAVGTTNVQANAITDPSTALDLTGYSGLNATTETDLGTASISKTISAAAGPVLVSFTLVAATIRNSAVSSTQRGIQVILTLKRGSSYLSAARIEGNFVPGLGMTVPITLTVIDAPGAGGPFTYKPRYEAHDDVSDTKQLFDAGSMYLQATEMKR